LASPFTTALGYMDTHHTCMDTHTHTHHTLWYLYIILDSVIYFELLSLHL